MFQFLVNLQKKLNTCCGVFFGGVGCFSFSGIIIQEPGLAFGYQRQSSETTSQYIVLIFKKIVFIIFYSLFKFCLTLLLCVLSLMLVSFLPSTWLIHLSSQLNRISFWNDQSYKVLLKQIQCVIERDDQTMKSECSNFPFYQGKDTLVLSSSLFITMCLKYLFAACDLYFSPWTYWGATCHWAETWPTSIVMP